MHLKETCCSKDKWEMTFPSFSAVFIHTFAMEGEVHPGRMREADKCNYGAQFKAMKKALKPDPEEGDVPVSSLAEVAGKPIVKMAPDVEELLFSARCMNDGQVARYSMRSPSGYEEPYRNAIGARGLVFDALGCRGEGYLG